MFFPPYIFYSSILCMYVCAYVQVSVCMRAYVCVCLCVCICVSVHVCFTQLWIRISLHKHDLLGFSSAAFFPRTENLIWGFKDGVSRQCSHPLGTSSALSDLHFPTDSCTCPHSTGLSLGERLPVFVLERCSNVGLRNL